MREEQEKILHICEGVGVEIGGGQFPNCKWRVDPYHGKGGGWISRCGSDTGLPDESVDFVVASHSLEHIPDPHKAAADWFRILKSKGGVGVIVPNGALSYWIKHDPRSVEKNGPGDQHLHTFTLEDLNKVFTEAGFVSVENGIALEKWSIFAIFRKGNA